MSLRVTLHLTVIARVLRVPLQIEGVDQLPQIMSGFEDEKSDDTCLLNIIGIDFTVTSVTEMDVDEDGNAKKHVEVSTGSHVY